MGGFKENEASSEDRCAHAHERASSPPEAISQNFVAYTSLKFERDMTCEAI